MPTGKPMTEKWKAEIVADLRSNMTVEAILRKHQIGYDRLQGIQAEYGLFRDRGKRPSVDPFADDYDNFMREWDRVRLVVLKALGAKT